MLHRLTEHNRLRILHVVLGKEIGDICSDCSMTVGERYLLVVIFLCVLLLFDGNVVLIRHPLRRNPPLIDIDGWDVNDKRRQEPIFSALLQRVRVNGLAKVRDIAMAGIGIVLWRSGHTNLRGTAEVIQNIVPWGIQVG